MADVQETPAIDAAEAANNEINNNKRPASDLPENEAKRPASASDESIEIKIQFGKVSKVVTRLLDSTVAELKLQIEEATSVPPPNQKLIFKGQLKDSQTIRETGLKNGSRLMVIGTKPDDTKIATNDKPAKPAADWDAVPKKEPWSTQDKHKKVLVKGVPEDAWPGIEDKQVPLRQEQTYIPGLLNSQGVKVRLTFKDDLQQLWIGAASHTQKVPYGSITKIEAQAIEGQEKYSILRVQLGAAASNNYWLYYVPSQHVAAIKMRILGVASLLE